MRQLLFLLVMISFSCSTEENTVNNTDRETSDIEMKASNVEYSDKQETTDMGEKIVSYAASLKGIPYKEAGRDASGFDCSGFVYYVYKQHNVDVPHSSRHLAELGLEVDSTLAQPGDLVFFRGTNPDNAEVGHVGIVVSKPGEPVKFIHASSANTAAYVKYDSLARPNYKRRFLKVKRVL